MALTLTVGTNSYVTLAEANDYMEEKWTASATWATLSDDTKKQLLISAYRWMRRDPNYSLSATVTTARQYAQIELAWYMYEYWDEHEERDALHSQGVRDFTLSKWKEKLEQSELPTIVRDLLDDDLLNAGGYFVTVEREYEENIR
jgi:hypothetical protein